MSYKRYSYFFQGPFDSADKLEHRAGVYVIWCKSGEKWICLDVGQSHDVQSRVKNHDRASEWQKHCRGMIYYAALDTPYLDETGRTRIESALRQRDKPLCGER